MEATFKLENKEKQITIYLVNHRPNPLKMICPECLNVELHLKKEKTQIILDILVFWGELGFTS